MEGNFIKGDTNVPLVAVGMHFSESSTVCHGSDCGVEENQLTPPFRVPFGSLTREPFSRISEFTKEFVYLSGFSHYYTEFYSFSVP